MRASSPAVGYARAVAQQRQASETQHQQRGPAPAQRAKRKADDMSKEKPSSDQLRAAMPTASNAAPVKKSKQSPSSQNSTAASKESTARASSQATPNVLVRQSMAAPKPAAVAPARKAETSLSSTQKGMQFFTPTAPASLLPQQIQLIRTGQVHKLSEAASPLRPPQNTSQILEYLVAVGTAVPIPKALIFNSLKERLNIPGFKNLASSAGFVIPREVSFSSWPRTPISAKRLPHSSFLFSTDCDCCDPGLALELSRRRLPASICQEW